MHRIIRRGRPYGEKFDASHKPKKDQTSRGMLFIALNADIAGQFEMIQHSWLNNPRFGGMYAGVDSFGHLRRQGDVIVIQNRPVNVYLDRPKPFVRMRGGAYFFLPGIEALRSLANG
jgi:deferrochelatase/peroxidase EfeB